MAVPQPAPGPTGGASPVQVLAQIVASVVRVPTTPGQHVVAGETLVVVESMKMEIPVAAPTTGTLRSVLVAPGDVVEEGDAIALIDADD